MKGTRGYLWILLLVIGWAASLPAAEENMIGRQSHNKGMLALPRKTPITIDGDLSDWNRSGRIWVFADIGVRSRYSAEVAAQWDTEALYLSVFWKDPTPMFSIIDPAFDPNKGWTSDAVQLRVRTPDQTSWFTMWYFTAKKMPVMHIAYWKDPRNQRKGTEDVLLFKENGTDLGRGAQMAYARGADNKSYVQEIRIPWKLIYKEPPAIEAGLAFRMGMEFLWGGSSGDRPIHRYADNLAPGHTSREFFWSARDAWGPVTLSDQKEVPLRRYVSSEGTLPGTIPVRASLPKNASRFTLVIETPDGQRVRNLAGDFDPAVYKVEDAGDSQVVQVLWDGLDDKGKLVEPGAYRVRGLTHEGLGASYEMCFYNPGTPPWPTASGSGAWGADHAAPSRVARAGDMTILGWGFAEGGHGMIGINADGQKVWGEKRGAAHLAADEKYVYAIPRDWHTKDSYLIRLTQARGEYAPFVLDGKPRPFDLPVSSLVGEKPRGKVTGLAAGGGRIAVAFSEQGIAILDASTAALQTVLAADKPSSLAFGPQGNLFALQKEGVYRYDPAGGEGVLIKTPGLGKAVAIDVDNEGNVLVVDMGPDRQVKAYTPEGKPAYTCGKKGGRPIRGAFDSQAMLHVSDVACDAQGHVWVTESWNYPRRVSVWKRDGSLLRDYIGNTGYAGTGTFLHDQDPNLAYVGPIELQLDKKNRSWSVKQILWNPDTARGETFAISTKDHANPTRFRSDASGTMREYMFVIPYRGQAGYVIFMERAAGWKPVAAITTVARLSGGLDHRGQPTQKPAGEWKGLNGYDGVFWNDTNKDGIPTRDECEIVKTKHPWGEKRAQPGLPLGSGWGGRMGKNLVFYARGITEYAPIGFDDEGAPRYGSAGMRTLSVEDWGTLVPVPEEDRLLCLSFKGYSGPTRVAGIDTKNDRLSWTYPNPFPGVHGSHRATMPKPGMLIGPLKIVGVVKANDDAGRVFLMRGNLGQDFFMTTDGLFVGAMFQDGRLPGASLPNKESELVGMPMETFSHGSEAFNGWFGRQDDGKVRMTTGFPRQAAMILDVTGLKTIRRLPNATLEVNADMLAQAAKDNAARRAAAEAGSVLIARPFKTPPTIDGKSEEWKSLPAVAMEREGQPVKGTCRMGYDAKNLYLLYEVNDPTPWRNLGKDHTKLFKTGDAVDLQLCVDENAAKSAPKRGNPGKADKRIVFAKLGKQPVAVLMNPVSPDKAHGVTYHSPVGDKRFDEVRVLANAQVRVTRGSGTYTVEASVPLQALALTPKRGLTLYGDVGFILSDEAGQINTARVYWSNKDTNLVSDLPQEAWFVPKNWSKIRFE